MGKFDAPFVEHVFRLYAPEGTKLFSDLLDSMAYQMGVRDTLAAVHKGKSLSEVQTNRRTGRVHPKK